MAQIRGNTQILDGSIEFGQLSTLNAYSTNLTTSASAGELARADAIKSYVDGLVDGSLKTPEAYDPTGTGNYPLTYGGEAVQSGDSFRITANQVDIGSTNLRTVNIEDLLIALVDAPSATDGANWMVAESNRVQATETTLGVVEIATQVEADAGLDDLRYITPLKLETYMTNAGISAITAGAGIVNNTGTFDIVATNLSMDILAGSIGVNVGTTNGTSLEVSASGLELAASITGARAFSGGDITFNVGSGNNILLNDNEIANAGVTTNIPLSMTATTDYGNGNGTAAGDVVDQFRAEFTDDALINAVVELKALVDAAGASASSRKYNETATIAAQTASLDAAPGTGFTNGVVYLNGVRLILTTDYTVTNAITGVITCTAQQTLTAGDVVIMDYTDA